QGRATSTWRTFEICAGKHGLAGEAFMADPELIWATNEREWTRMNEFVSIRVHSWPKTPTPQPFMFYGWLRRFCTFLSRTLPVILARSSRGAQVPASSCPFSLKIVRTEWVSILTSASAINRIALTNRGSTMKLLAIATVLAAAVWGQTERGNITGSVTDTSDA